MGNNHRLTWEQARRLLPPGAEYIRSARHGHLFRLPNGATIMVASTPATGRRKANFEACLKRLLETPHATT